MNTPPNPVIPEGQFAIIQVELRTGKVLTLEGRRHEGSGECFLMFTSLAAAQERAREIVESNPEIECIIDNDQNEVVATVRNENFVSTIVENARKARERRRKWWKFW